MKHFSCDKAEEFSYRDIANMTLHSLSKSIDILRAKVYI